MTVFHIIYKLLDPRDRAVRYVGETTRGLGPRTYSTASGIGGNALKIWVAGLRHLRLDPMVLEIETVPDCDWEAAEQFWIAHHLAQGDDLLNATEGGRRGKRIVAKLTDADRALAAEYLKSDPDAAIGVLPRSLSGGRKGLRSFNPATATPAKLRKVLDSLFPNGLPPDHRK